MASDAAPEFAKEFRSSRKARVKQAISGEIVALGVVPYLISQWAPQSAALGWAIVYGSVSVVASLLLLRWDNRWVDQVWGILIGVVMAFLPISVLVWSGQPSNHMWIAIACVLAQASFQQTALPVADLPEWRAGIAITSTVSTVAIWIAIHPLVAVGFAALLVATTANADTARRLKDRLERDMNLVEQAATHDELTGLLNRRGLADARRQLHGEAHSVLVVDVNRFKSINDTFGYEAGDQALKVLARRLRDRLPPAWTLGRHGGDEFVAIAPGRQVVPPSLLEPVHYTIDHYGSQRALQLAVSAGVSEGQDGDEISMTQREAGYALQAAKNSGDGMARFGGDLRSQFERSMTVFRSVATGFDESRLDADAQVIVSGDEVVGFEILARWIHEDGQRRGPAEFLAMAAENGLMPRVSDLMLQKSMAFAARFNHLPNAPYVSVNMTVADLLSLDLVDRVDALLDQHRLPPERLMIEITEAKDLEKDRRWEETARRLRTLGTKLAIDDFGAGYSSWERLHSLPISHLKFDGAVVRSASGPLSEVIRGLTRFAGELQIEIIAEGVETLDQLTTMRALGVNTFQGWHFGYPTMLDQSEQEFLQNRIRQSAPVSDVWPG